MNAYCDLRNIKLPFGNPKIPVGNFSPSEALMPKRKGLMLVPALILGLVATAIIATPAQAETTGFRFVDIPASDGTILKANVIEPMSAGPHPAVIFVSSWGLNDAEYLAQASEFADDGYTVVSYTPRGWWGSGGQIDTAGPKDIADVSSVIDWTIANTSADPEHIGAAGVSYGAGISLIASAFDARIKAVGALSGWTDLVDSLYGGDTRHAQSVALLQVAADLLGTPSAELTTVLNDFWNDRDTDVVKAFGRMRSAQTYQAQINANHPAILMANAFGDSLFEPDQLIAFYNGLTGRKRLELAPGDHAVVEATGLVGLDNHVWTSLHGWFDQYLAGAPATVANGVVLRPLTGGTETYPDWAHVTSTTTRYGLGGKDWWSATGPLSTGSPTGWSSTIYTGFDTSASGGVALLTNAWGALTGDRPTIWMPGVNRTYGAVWVTGWYGSDKAIRGIPEAHLTIKPSRSQGTVVAYLYDLDQLGYADLITFQPATWTGRSTTTATSVDIKFPATAYTIGRGHALALVIDTQDGLFLDENPFGAGITFSATSYLDVPFH